MKNDLDKTEKAVSLRKKAKQLFKNKHSRKKVEAEIFAITDQWQSTFDSVNDAIWLLDKEHNILRSNKKADLLFGTETIGKKCYNIVHGKDYPIKGCPVQLAFKQKCHKTMEFQIGDKWYDISADPIMNANGNVTSAVHIVRDIATQRKIEDDLRESEEKYRTLTFNIPGMTYRGGVDWSTEIVTNLEEVSGYSIDEWDIQKINWLNLIHPDDKQAVFKDGTKLSKNPISMVQEYRIIHKDEKIRWVRDYKTSLFKDDGTFIGIDGIIFDITARKKAEEALKESEERFRSIIQNTQAGYFFIDNEGLFQEVNKAWLNLYKYENFEEVIGKHFTDVQQLDDLGSAKNLVEGIKDGNPDYMHGDFSRKCKDGSIGYHSFSARPVYIVDEVAGIEGFIIDITKQKQAENDLLKAKEKTEESEKTLNTIIENIPFAVFAHNLDGEFIKVNNFSSKYTGYSKQELLKMNVADIDKESLSRNDREKTWLQLNQLGEKQIISNHYKKDGSTYPVEITLTSITLKDKPILLSIVQDISERQKAEQAIKECAAKFKNMFERHSAIMLLIEPKTGLIIDANNSAIKFYGYNKVELCSMKIDEINTLSQEQVLIERTNAINEDQNYFIFPHKLANGETRIVEVHSSPIEFNEQRILFSILHDITKRKEAEQALKESELLLKQTQKISKVGGWSYDVQSKQIKYTDAIHEIHAKTIKTPEEGIQFYHPEDKELVWNSFSDAISKQKPYDLEVRFINAQGDNLFVRTIGQPIIENGKVVKILGDLVDITKRKTAEQALKESEAKYRTIIDNSGDAIAIRQKGKFVFANKALSKMLDYSIIELVETENSLIFDSDILNDMEKRLSKSDLNENFSIQFETMITKKNKTKIDVEIFEKIISYNKEKAQLVIVRDITKQKAIMQVLQRGAEQTKGLNEYIPICAGCSLIRDDEKENKPWVKPADYISERLPEILFSHSMCPDCLKKWDAEIDSDDGS